MASEELQIILRAKDYATGVFNKLVHGTASLVKHLFSLRGILGVTAAAWAGMRIMDHASAIESIGIGFEKLTERIGGAEAVMGALRKGTKDTVSDFKLMESANRAMLFGVGKSADEFELLATVARRLGRAVGRDTVDALNDMFVGIGRQSRLFLDNIGLIIRVADANRAYAKQLGKTVDSLTDIEKRQAFWNATVEASREMVGKLGPDIYLLADAWEQFKATVVNVANELLASVIPSLKELFTSLGDYVRTHRREIFGFFADLTEIISTFTIAATEMFIVLDENLGHLTALVQRVKILGLTTKSIWQFMQSQVEGMVDLAGGQSKFEESMRSLIEAADLSDELFEGSKGRADKMRETSRIIEHLAESMAEKLRLVGSESKSAAQEAREYLALLGDMRRVTEKFVSPPPILDLTLNYWVDQRIAAWELKEQLAKETEIKLGRDERQMERITREWEEQRDAMHGVISAFQEMRLKSEEWGRVLHDGIMDATDAIGSGIVDGLMTMSENFRETAKAAREMAISIVRDLARVALQLSITQALQAGFGALFGATGLGVPHVSPDVLASDRALVRSITPVLGSGGLPTAQHGADVMRGGWLRVGEAGPEFLRLPSGSSVRPGPTGNMITVNITNMNPSYRTREQERAIANQQKEEILAAVSAKYNSSVSYKEALS